MENRDGEPCTTEERPSPADFELYLPWACQKMGIHYEFQVIKVYQKGSKRAWSYQNMLTTARGISATTFEVACEDRTTNVCGYCAEYASLAMTERSKKGKSRIGVGYPRLNVDSDHKNASSVSVRNMHDQKGTSVIRMEAVNDICENLVQIKFDRNTVLPRNMFKIIGLIIPFQKYLNTITINSGLDNYTVYEISKFLPMSHITDICLDDCYLKQPNYYMLLENANFLKHLSLRRCKIGDAAIKLICVQLSFPMPASKTLSILNLSSNRITDTGATYLAEVLRSNRQLSYLNLANNMLTDKGAQSIFEIFMEFSLTAEELRTSKCRKIAYLHRKNELMAITIRELRLLGDEKRLGKRKSVRPNPSLKKAKAVSSQKSLTETTYLPEVDVALLENATTIVEKTLGEDTDPFSDSNIFFRYGNTYCIGNNTLCSLNLSYNSLSYLSISKLLSVLLYQKAIGRKPIGLLTVSVEGNSLPHDCKEYWQIDKVLEVNLLSSCRGLSFTKKRNPQKSTH